EPARSDGESRSDVARPVVVAAVVPGPDVSRRSVPISTVVVTAVEPLPRTTVDVLPWTTIEVLPRNCAFDALLRNRAFNALSRNGALESLSRDPAGIDARRRRRRLCRL